MNIKTYLAVAELAQAAAHQHGVVGPVEFTVCRPHRSETNPDWCGNCGDCPQCCPDVEDDPIWLDEDDYEPPPTVDTMSMDELDQAEEFFYARR